MGYWVFFLILSIPGVINNLGNFLMSLSPCFFLHYLEIVLIGFWVHKMIIKEDDASKIFNHQ